MKERILSILLCLCMVACMLPTVAFAADTGKAIRLVNTNNPTGGILGYKNNNNSYDYIYMGSYNSSPVKWRVLDDQTNTGATGLFLLSEDLLGSGGHGDVYDVYFDGTSPYSNAWQGSDAQGWCNTFESSNLDSRELAAILSTTKSDEAFTSSTHNASFAASTNILNSDQVFFLSAQEAENGQYGFTDEAARVANYGAYASVWWLRSPFAKFTSSAGAVDGFGRVYDCGVGIVWAARPAFNLNLNSVLFTSAAVGGKPDGGLTAVPEYSGNEWKLTLLDSNRNFAVTEKTADGYPNDTITLNYSGATTGANEYISAIIADNNGAQYYGRVAQPTAESGTVEIKIPSDIAPGNYTLKVFSEQYNGDYKTDYASNFTDIALTVEKQVEEQFFLTPGGRYYFDLSAMNIPGTANGGNSDGAVSLPDTSLHYVPFTYVGTIEAYKLTSEMATTEEYAQQNKYPHSLFVADYAVTHTISWGGLNDEGLIFGKNYASGGVDYTLRAPSVGSNSTGSGESQHDTPSNNEWDRILDKNSGYIQNWNKMYSWGQDTSSAAESFRAYRGYNSARFWYYTSSSFRNVYLGFRPVLEVLNPGTLGSDGLKVVTLDLGGGKLGNSSEDIQIIVKTGSEFTAPASDGLTRPDGDAGSFFMWLGSNGKFYAPGDSVPAEVTKLTAQWTAPTYAVTLNTNGGTINSGNVTSYTYGVGATLPTAGDMTYTGHTFVGWYDNENLTGSPVTAIGGTETGNKEYWAKWEINQYTITFDTNGGSEIAPITQDYGTKITTPADPTRKGYTFKGWDKEIPKTMPAENITVKAQWEINQYTITFDTNGGSEIAPITQNYGTKITTPADPTRKGYTFKGWDKEIPKTMPAENITVKAQWEINQYAITFDTNGGSEIAPITQDYGTKITTPADPTRKGYTFKGWDKEIPKTMPAENITVKAQWEINQYAITFDTNGGSEIAPITQDYGTAITAPADPTRKGYTFKGWDKEIPETMPAENMTVKAQWEINQYAITFDTNGGSKIAPITQDYGTAITAPADPTRKGYTFKGWDKEIPKTMPAENITVKAQWEINQYTITFDTNGGSEIAPITQDYGTAITAPADPTRKGYTFKGWDKEIPKTMPAENITVKAQWEINQYTITFDTNGGSEIAPITQDYGTAITAPADPTRKGYTFKGWDKEIPKTMPAENITVKAQWEINQYTITFDTNGGSEIAPITQDYGTAITAPADPTRKGYTFKGWDKEIPETMPAENITVKAQWEINQYAITFDTNGGSEIAPITQDYGTAITAPADPTRKGYTFKGWDKEIPKTMPAENITVKAQWEINQYTITFDTNGGSEIAPITQNYGTKITAPADPTRKGYTFKGWDKEIPETMPAENITITARWRDTEKPTGEIIIGTNKWNKFLNELTFGIFFKDTQEVTINAVDNSGTVFVSYLVTDKDLSEAELDSLVFHAYEEPFCIDPNGEYIVYVMLVDENINITYLRSDRLTLDNIHPVIGGIENGKTYCEAQTVTVDEKYVDTVTVNGKAATLDANGGFVLPPTNGEQKIVVTDKAGNNAEMTVTVNNGHTFGEWVSDNDGTHTRKCTVDGCNAFETENCSGGNATCTKKAVCDVCGKAYGELDKTNHEGGVQEWTTRTAFVHEQKWNCCGAVIVTSEVHEWKDGVCRECGYVCPHNDADKNHICDYCKKTISTYENAATEEIKNADTVTAKLPDDSKSPQTGDNSNIILWIALLIISGGVMKGVTAFGKNKKHSAKIKDK